ncbi:MAG TPA: hypothetical protein VGH80_01420 [Xanthomonadaceae bacterium]|jgi:hypothetical protein
MHHRALFTALALALALPAFAQDNTQPPPASGASMPDPSATSEQSASDSTAANDSSSADTTSTTTTPHHRHHRRAPPPPQSADSVGGADSTPSNNPAYNANTAGLSGNEPKVVAYQYSNRLKHYPAVDRGHVPGDPPVIRHDDDQAPVPNPTTTAVTVPPSTK